MRLGAEAAWNYRVEENPDLKLQPLDNWKGFARVTALDKALPVYIDLAVRKHSVAIFRISSHQRAKPPTHPPFKPQSVSIVRLALLMSATPNCHFSIFHLSPVQYENPSFPPFPYPAASI